MSVTFNAQNIRLDDGTLTKPDSPWGEVTSHRRFLAAKGIFDVVFPGEKSGFRVADVGCLEGGYSVEFARLGFHVLGIEVRESNIAACRYVKSKTNLPKLEFVADNAWNIQKCGRFDAVFCSGLLYHLDKPRKFLEVLASVTNKLLFLDTHYSTTRWRVPGRLLARFPSLCQRAVLKLLGSRIDHFNLSRMSINEGLPGRWFLEFRDDKAFSARQDAKWSSWDNRRSFWIQREYLLQAVGEVGFDVVLEQFDGSENIAHALLHGHCFQQQRNIFLGIKTGDLSLR